MNGPEELHGACAPSAGPPGTSDGDSEERWAASREFRSAWPHPPGGLGSLDTCRAADPALRRFLSHRRTALGRARRRDLSRSHSDLTENGEGLDGSTGRPPGSDAGGVLRVGAGAAAGTPSALAQSLAGKTSLSLKTCAAGHFGDGDCGLFS